MCKKKIQTFLVTLKWVLWWIRIASASFYSLIKYNISQIIKILWSTYLWSALGSIQIRLQKTMKFHTEVALQNFAFACLCLDKQLHQFDSIGQMASIEMHYVYDRIDNPLVQVEHRIGMVLLEIWIKIIIISILN